MKNRSRDYLRPCKNITVTNCILTTTCNGFKIGTESFSDFENIVFSNSVIKAGLPDEELAQEAAATIDPEHYGNALGPLSGLAVESVDGAHLRGVSVNNILMRDVRAPLFVRWQFTCARANRRPASPFTAEWQLGRTFHSQRCPPPARRSGPPKTLWLMSMPNPVGGW